MAAGAPAITSACQMEIKKKKKEEKQKGQVPAVCPPF